MVHRPADSRLLTNLLAREKDYAKQLVTLIDTSNASLASFSAYAAASSPPTSNVVLAVASALAGADDAARSYAKGVDEWRELMTGLKDLEEEVGNIMRDREILITRLIKASKSRKSSNNRDSLMALNQRYHSSSSLSLSADFSSITNTFNTPSKINSALPSSSKLVAAQAELQACEAHLASKERELQIRRVTTIKQGLTTRCRGMVECGLVWSDMGRAALQALEILGHNNSNLPNGDIPYSKSQRLSTLTSDTNLTFHSIDNTLAFPENDNKPLPDPVNDDNVAHTSRPSSPLSSVGPSQSASQVNLALPPIKLPNGDVIANYNTNGPSRTPEPGPGPSTQAHLRSQAYAQPQPTYPTHSQIQIPPAHAISELSMPTSTFTPPPHSDEHPAHTQIQSLTSASAPSPRHVLTRRITEEELEHHNRTDDIHSQPQAREPSEVSSSENEEEELKSGKLAVVENPRFAPSVPSVAGSGSDRPPERKRFSLRPPARKVSGGRVYSESEGSERHDNEAKGGSGFFGSLRGFFGGRAPKDREREASIAASDTSPSKPSLGTLFKRKETTTSPPPSVIHDNWKTRTDKNVRTLQHGADEDTDDGELHAGLKREPLFSPLILSDEPLPMERLKGVERRPSRMRVASDVGLVTPAGVHSEDEGKHPSAATRAESGRRLKKNRAVKPRSSSVPPGNRHPKLSEPTPPVPSAHKSNTSVNVPKPAESDGDSHQDKGIEKKKSLKKTSVKAGPVSTAKPSSANFGDLSRKSSIASAASAPTGPSKARSTTLGQGMEIAHVGRRSSMGSGSRAAMQDRGSNVTITPTVSTKKTHRRTQSADLGSGSKSVGPPQSLMSIVEDVAKGNRAARDAGVEEKVRLEERERARVKGVGSTGPGIEVVKAPPRAGRQVLLEADKKAGLVTPVGLEVPRAPGSVLDLLRDGGGENKGAPSVRAEAAPVRGSRDAPVAGPSSAAGMGVGGSSGSMTSTTSSRPAKSPLRSALRYPSRTPSPMPGPSSVAGSSGVAPTATKVFSQGPSPNGVVHGAEGLLPPVRTGPLPWEEDGNNMRAPSAQRGEKGKKKEKNAAEEADEGDSSSVSSYETGHEVFISDEDTEVDERFPRTVHMKDYAAPLKTFGTTRDDTPAVGAPPVPSKPTSPPPPALPLPQAYRRQFVTSESQDHNFLGSDVSTSTASYAGPSQGKDQDQLGNAPGQGQGQGQPYRRKSVRVSLQPTFSPTPPAIEDDDEDEKGRHAPWAWESRSSGGAVKRDQRQRQSPTRVADGGVQPQPDLWQDSSDEDVEYKKARKLLARATKREKAARS